MESILIHKNCPWCRKKIIIQNTHHGEIVVEKDRIPVSFDYKEDKEGIPLEGQNVFLVITERRGDLVIGRNLTLIEKRRLKTKNNPGTPYTFGRKPHNCPKWDGKIYNERRSQKNN